MKNIFLPFLFLFLFSCIGKEITSDNKIVEVPAFRAMDKKIAAWVDSGYYNGAAVMIKQKDRVLFESYYANYTDTTSLHVASAGKWLAAAAIAAVVDDGKLSWDDSVKKYLPEFDDIKGNATLSQLFSHTAGYPDYQPGDRPGDDYQTLKESVYNIVGLPADTFPGTKFKYGGLAMQVAGRMAEVATGKDWETIFQEYMAQPLDMHYTRFTPVSKEGGFSPMLGGGAKTCLRDFMNFLQMISEDGKYNGKQIISLESIAYMQADHVGSTTFIQPEYAVNTRQNYHTGIYGLGEWREELNDNGEATLISSPGWAGAYPWIDKTNGTYGFILAKVNVHKANHDGFSSMYASPVLPLMVRDALKQMNYPEELNYGFAGLEGAQLYYEEKGEGEPLILIHGHSLNHTMWDTQFDEFAQHFRTIRYDIRGYGYSSPQDEINQFTHVEDLIRLMDYLEIEKAHIVGLSLGGYIGADMLGWFPERILSAVLASGNVRLYPKPSEPMGEEEAHKRDEEIAVLRRKGIETMKREWFYGLMNSGGSQKERMRNPLWNIIYQWDAWQPLHKEVRVIAGGDAYDKLKINKPEVPVMILEGSSPTNHFSENPEILEHLPNGRLMILEDCGHMMNMEQPEAFNETVLTFIKNDR